MSLPVMTNSIIVAIDPAQARPIWHTALIIIHLTV